MRRIPVVALGGLLAVCVVTVAQAGSSSTPRVWSVADRDVRSTSDVRVALTARQQLAIRAMRGVTVRTSELSGTPASVIRYGGFLTRPSAAAPAVIAREYLADHAALFRLSRAEIATFDVAARYVTERSGATQLTLQQLDQGRKVEGARLTFVIDRHGRIASVGGVSYPDVAVPTTASLSAAEAVRVSASELGLDENRVLRAVSSATGPTRRTVFRNSLSEGLYRPMPISAELVTFPLGGAEARLGWKTTIESHVGLYQTIVDAISGDVLYRHSLTYFAGPEGNVYTSQNPTTTQQIVPFTGWVAGRTTSGNNVNAYLDLNATNAIGYQPQTPDTPDPNFQHFDYTFTNAYQTSGGTNINTDRDATLTQLFYWVNRAHDYYYSLGFTEPSRNFQTDNFGRGGAGGDAVLAEAFNGWGTGTEKLCKDKDDNDILCRNNANFNAGPSDGTPGRLQVYLGSTPFPFRESEMEGDTILHEYGHGVSNRLVGGGSLGSGVQTGGLGEGWSDFFAISFFNDPVIFEYSGGGDANTPPTSGFRRIASYATSTEKYSLLCNPSCEVHNDGEIWATALWNLRVKLGQSKTEKLVVDGMKGTATNPSFLTARDAILTADQTDFGGADKCTIWGVFAASEMGKSATSSSDQKTVTAGTDGPAECTPVANAGGPYSVGEGANVPLDASGSTENGDGPFTYGWDLDNDNDFDDATGKQPSGVAFGQDGTYPVKVKVTNANGFSNTASVNVTVTNVVPTVTTLTANDPDENGLVTASVVVTDPGWLDTPSATIDWGDGGGASSLSGTVENNRPDATLTASPTHTYGDNGTFTLTVCPSDEAPGPCRSITISVGNVNPTAAIDKTSATTVNGVATFLAHIGQPVPFSGSSTDPGSDDLLLTWKWADGTPDATPKYMNDAVNFPLGDPFPSPSINPRNVTDSRTHTFGGACFYTIDFSAADDDAGASPVDHVAVIITGNASVRQNAGYWQTQYRPRPTAFTESQRTCYLQIAGFMSSVFHEVTDASTVAKAFNVLFVGGNNGTAKQQLDRQLLTSWLNFANGSLDLGTLVDTNTDKVPDTSFATVISNAEAIRLNPSSTDAQLRAQKDLLERING
jgi:hypothetical protein